MEIEDEMPISDARANLTEVVSVVRLQDRIVHLTKRGAAQAAIVPDDVAALIEAAGGLDAARAALKGLR